ncbi:MAG: hypothetical protein KAR79_03915 [Simkaniaceae bacterium]|nr:hypothetical protein [Simkaniaceae bacterium]
MSLAITESERFESLLFPPITVDYFSNIYLTIDHLNIAQTWNEQVEGIEKVRQYATIIFKTIITVFLNAVKYSLTLYAMFFLPPISLAHTFYNYRSNVYLQDTISKIQTLGCSFLSIRDQQESLSDLSRRPLCEGLPARSIPSGYENLHTHLLEYGSIVHSIANAEFQREEQQEEKRRFINFAINKLRISLSENT